MKPSLTARQRQILDFVESFHGQHGVSPSLREIQSHFRLASPFGVKRHLDTLTEKGALKRLDGKARGIVPAHVQPRRPQLTPIPLYGVIPAGRAVDAQAVEPERHVTVDVTALGVRSGTRLFALQVRGDSMIGANILDGDVVFLTAREPRPRDIVAALIDGESTLKRFLLQRGQPFLRAENSRYPDLLPATELVIQGVMVGLLRAFSPE